MCSNLYSIQYTNGLEYAAQAVARVAEVEDVPDSRGLILDRNGKVLVSNEISYQVTLDMSRMGEPEERCANLLSPDPGGPGGGGWPGRTPCPSPPLRPFTYTGGAPFYTASTNEAGEPEYQMTPSGPSGGLHGVDRGPGGAGGGGGPGAGRRRAGGARPVGPPADPGGPPEAGGAREEPQPYRLPTAEELLGEMCRDLDIKGQGRWMRRRPGRRERPCPP